MAGKRKYLGSPQYSKWEITQAQTTDNIRSCSSRLSSLVYLPLCDVSWGEKGTITSGLGKKEN